MRSGLEEDDHCRTAHGDRAPDQAAGVGIEICDRTHTRSLSEIQAPSTLEASYVAQQGRDTHLLCILCMSLCVRQHSHRK